MRAAIWTRVSTDEQDDGTSPGTQLSESRALCARNGWDPIRVFQVTYSAEWAEDIPDWRELMEAIRRRDFDVLVALSYDRLARHHWDVGTTLRACQRHGVKVAFVKDEVPDGEYGDLFVFMKGFSGHTWRKGIIESAGRGQRAKMHGSPAAGVAPRPLGSQRPPFGLRWVEEYETRRGLVLPMKRRFEENPATIDTLRCIFAWYDEGASLRELDRRLRSRGIRPADHERTGCMVWSPPTLKKILGNENYVGVGYVGTTDRRKQPGGKRRSEAKPREEWTRLPEGTFPRVIDESLFARVQDRLKLNRRECPPGNRRPAVGLLRRIGVCGYCGRSLRVVNQRGIPRYRCDIQNRTRHGCPAHTMNVELLDGQVWSLVTWLLHTPGALEAKLFGQPQPDPTAGALPQVDANLKRLEQDRERTQRRLRATDDDELATAYEQDLKVILAEVRAAEAERLKLLAQRDAWQAGQERRQGVLDYAAQLRAELDGLDFDGRRNVLLRLGATVRLYRDGQPAGRWDLTTRWRPVTGQGVALDEDTGIGWATTERDGKPAASWVRIAPSSLPYVGEDELVSIVEGIEEDREQERAVAAWEHEEREWARTATCTDVFTPS